MQRSPRTQHQRSSVVNQIWTHLWIVSSRRDFLRPYGRCVGIQCSRGLVYSTPSTYEKHVRSSHWLSMPHGHLVRQLLAKPSKELQSTISIHAKLPAVECCTRFRGAVPLSVLHTMKLNTWVWIEGCYTVKKKHWWTVNRKTQVRGHDASLMHLLAFHSHVNPVSFTMSTRASTPNVISCSTILRGYFALMLCLAFSFPSYSHFTANELSIQITFA